jgi:feruloyl esterase
LYYGARVEHAYFDGCSTGGRQSMVEGTRYPADYDGLIVGDPAISYHNGRFSTLKQGLAFVPAGTYIPPATAVQADARGNEGTPTKPEDPGFESISLQRRVINEPKGAAEKRTPRKRG